jgi:UDPglucose 6-dehydrogenase
MSYSVSIFGTGYVGLCTAVGFASKGYRVVTVTHDPVKAERINEGSAPFYEPELQKLLQNAVKNRFLRCSLNYKDAVLDTDITFITVGTPNRPSGEISLDLIERAAREIGEALRWKKTYHLVVVKSTVVPGTTEKLVKPVLEGCSGKRCGADFGLCMNPEFLREGSAIHDTLNPDRIVIGEYDKQSGDLLESFYISFFKEDVPPVIRTNLPTAELIKYANNAFLATKISFINTIANICQRIPNADVRMVAKAIGMDKRISPLFLNAGLGYGGSCFPKDVKALIAFSRKQGYDPTLLDAVEKVNKVQPYRAVELCEGFLGDLKGKQIAVLGLAFKPNTDDMREAVAIEIVNKLLEEGAKIVAYDPAAVYNAKAIFQNKVQYASSPIECLKGADCCIIVTEWEEFKKLRPEDFAQNMRRPVLVDGRRIYNPEEYGRRLKFAAIGLGEQRRNTGFS